ncbi:FAD-dependent oxidoreductase [Micromonospora sp. NPDC048842]|uniref:NAD(P)/FAD-dependent oxidoreductase n=1 Tax=Micromonospora sp. NPDC048842 TaxID=3154346 RepID=UPI003406EE8A
MTHRLVVLGAGYAGLGAARRAARRLRRTDVEVTLINATDRFVERIRLHQLAAGQTLRDRPLRTMLDGADVKLVVARVTAIDVDASTVRMDAEPYTVGFDTLVYALGSGADVGSVPGVRQHAFTIAEAAQAQRLRSHLLGASAGDVVAVVGGGLTGIETATELAEAYPGLRIELVTSDDLGGWLSPPARRHLGRAFDRMGIGVRQGVRVEMVSAAGLRLDDGRDLDAEVVVWTAGFRVSALADRAGLAVDGRGRMIVDETCRSVSHPQVYGIGDAAAAPAFGGETRMSCQTGLPMGLYAADAIAAVLNGRTPTPLRIRYVWQNISLGRRDGITQFTRADDSPIGAVLTGRSAIGFKEAISRSTVYRLRHSGPVR